MVKVKNKTAREAIKKVSVKYNIPFVVIEEILYQYYYMIAKNIDKAETKEEFLIFNLPNLGKLYPSEKRLETYLNKKHAKSKDETTLS